MLSSLWSDIRYSARGLRRSPGFAAAAIVTIGLGVGINTGIFTILNGVLFRDLPAPDGHMLVAISQTFEGVPDRLGMSFTTEEHRAYNDRAGTLLGILGHSDPTRTTLGGPSPQEILGTIVTCNYFDVLRQPPVLGRALTPQDCAPGAAPVVVLAHDLWTTTFGADPQIVGRIIELNRQLFSVIGVARAGTYGGIGLYRTAYFAPTSAEPLLLPNERSFNNERRGWLSLIGRRSAALEQVRAELDVIAAQMDAQTPGRSTALTIERATPLPAFFRRVAVPVGAVVMSAFALVLLIACANVANLLLARATARSHEIGVRLSLGASRARVVRQLLTESALIAIAGGALGALVALWSFQALIAVAFPAISPAGIPPMFVDASPDIRVLVFTLALTFGTGVLFGAAPALAASKHDVHAIIKQDGAGTGRRGGDKLRATLVGVQVATCMVLMIAAALLLRGLSATQTIDPGFEYRDVAVASYDLTSAGYASDEAFAFQRRVLDEVNALPGVESAAFAILEPLRADSESAPVGLPTEERSRYRSAELNGVTPAYFGLVGIPIVRGRTFEDSELTDAATSVIVTETTARNFWPDQDPIGRSLAMAAGPNQEITLNVIGVARDAQVTSVGQVEPYYLYLPASPRIATLLQLLVKSRADFASTAAAVRAAMQALDPAVAVRVMPLEANLEYWRTLSGMLTVLAAGLGVLALVLAAVGIYAVVAYYVGRRTREIGLRLALGGQARDVIAFLLKRTMRPVVFGAAIGVAGAVALSQVLTSVLFGVSPLDPLSIAGATLFVLSVALAAAVVAGRPAIRVAPMASLRRE